MKKFLSIMLAVMMVLSTVSFAAPSAFVAMDTANAAPVVEVPAEEAELAALVTDKSAYGTLIYKVDFEQDDFAIDGFQQAYAQLKSNNIASYKNPAFDLSNVTTYTNAAGDGFSNAQLVTENGNTYVIGDVNAGYDGFFRMTKYNIAWPEGYYTFVVDAKTSAPVTSWAKQCNDTNIDLVELVSLNPNVTDWQTGVFQTANVIQGTHNSSTANNNKVNLISFFVTPNNAAAGTVAYDNWEVYYKPATVKLTIGGTTVEYSTNEPVAVSSLASYVSAPAGYALAGFALTEGGEVLTGSQYFFEDTTLYPVFNKDENVSEKYGKRVFSIDFEKEGISPELTYSENSKVLAMTDKARSDFDLSNVYNIFNGFASVSLKKDGANTYLEGVSGGQYNFVQIAKYDMEWPRGYYTFKAKVKTSAIPVNVATHVNGYNDFITVKYAGFPAADTWYDFEYSYAFLDDYVSGGGHTVINNFYYAFNAAAGVTFDVDDIEVFYKPASVDVTLVYGGEEYLVEDVAPNGISAAALVEKAGIELPYGKAPAFAATEGGEPIVQSAYYFFEDTKLYVTFVQDENITAYGRRILGLDFENVELAVTDPNSEYQTYMLYDHASYYNPDYIGEKYFMQLFKPATGVPSIVEENGNKALKFKMMTGWQSLLLYTGDGNKGWGEGTFVYEVDLATSAATQLAITQSTSSFTATNPYTFNNGEYDKVVLTINEGYLKNNANLQFQFSAVLDEIKMDNINIYYRPKTVNLTVVNGTVETKYTDISPVVNTRDLLKDIVAPTGFKAALSAEKNGEALDDTITLASDAKLYVTYVEDETVSFDYGKALFIVDFENESAQSWWGHSFADNSRTDAGAQVWEVASYYDPMFQGQNYRIRFYINEATHVDQKTVVDENGNHYTYGTTQTQWAQVALSNWSNGAVTGKAGYYTVLADTFADAVPSGYSTSSGWTAEKLPAMAANKWDTFVATKEMTEDGVLVDGTAVLYNAFAASDKGVAKMGWDNVKLFYKPYTADVKVTANGATVKTLYDVSTTGVDAAMFFEGVKVRGYAVNGVKVGDKVYKAGDILPLPGDCTLALDLEVVGTNPATPTTADVEEVRLSDPMGLRFKAEMSKSDMDDVTAYGWIVTRETLLEQAGIAASSFEMTSNVKMVKGYNYGNGVETAKIFDEDDESLWFTAVLYFSNVEADGLPSVEKLADRLVARPFAVVDGEVLYGDATAPASIFEVMLEICLDEGDIWNSFNSAQQDYVYEILDKVDANQNNTPDIWEK